MVSLVMSLSFTQQTWDCNNNLCVCVFILIIAPGSAGPTSGAPDMSLTFGKAPARGTSAPTSPAKSRESLLQRVQSLTGAARDQGASIISSAASSVARVQAFNKDRCFTLLVLDDQNTDWSKYFRGKRLHGDYDIRVEQAEFCEIAVTASGDAGPTVSIVSYRSGSKVSTHRSKIIQT